MTFPNLEEIEAIWDGKDFYATSSSNPSPFGRWNLGRRFQKTIEGPALYFAVPHISCYGHALLDGVFPLFAILKKHNLLHAPITLILVSDVPLSHPCLQNILQLIRDLFFFRELIVIKKGRTLWRKYLFKRLLATKHTPFAGQKEPISFFSLYHTTPEAFKYIGELKKWGIQDNLIFCDSNPGENLVKEFVDYVLNGYKIAIPLIKKRVLIAIRTHTRLINNLDEITAHLRNNGYTVVHVNFAKMSIKNQIIQTIQSEYLVGTYGSNLVNAIFLKPKANVVVLWHKYAKYFWSRKYCIIHSAFLSLGVRLIEVDKPDYDSRDLYTESVHVDDYFYRRDGKNILRADKINIDALLKYPLPAMYEITNVNMYIDPNSLLKQMNQVI